MSDMLDLVFNQLEEEVQQIRERADIALARSERSEIAGGIVAMPYGKLPRAADGAGEGNIVKVTDGRKIGEGAGAGTGIPAYYDPSTDTWRRFSDDAAVTV